VFQRRIGTIGAVVDTKVSATPSSNTIASCSITFLNKGHSRLSSQTKGIIMTIYTTLRFDDMRGDLIRWLSARPRTYGEARGVGIATGPTWNAALLDGMLTIEGVDSEDVVDGVTHPYPDARLLMGPKGYAVLRALTSEKMEMPLAA
jgi:hypothetical protein